MNPISLFYGIRITMAFKDENPPSFKASYNGYKALVNIIEGNIISGFIPNRQLKMILGWNEIHRDELMQNWELARDHQELNRIEPLK